jgi:putative transposase
LHLISKLRSDAALYLPYDGPYPGRGPHRKYGAKLDPAALPGSMLRQRSVKDGIESSTYHGQVLHKEFEQPLNAVFIVKRTLTTQAVGYVILFSSDLTLGYEQLVDYYSLRFQIEFTFRDAKQYWGLEDFMNVTATSVTNAANLALFMVNLSRVLLGQMREQEPGSSVLDLKAHYRGLKYVEETIKMLVHKPQEDLIRRIVRRITSLGRIHPPKSSLDAA